MAINLTEAVQQRMGYQPLIKIDPNTQQVKETELENPHSLLAQATIPAVLTGLYKFTRNKDSSEYITRGNFSSNWLETIFGNHEEELIQKIAAYAKVSPGLANQESEAVAKNTVDIIRENIQDDATGDAVKTFMNGQRNNILPYLPTELQIGEMLNDNTIDDATNKMDGPISGLMHAIEKVFSGSEEETTAK